MNRKHSITETTIHKASGEKAIFSEDKLRRSLLRSGASPEVIDAIITQIIARIYNGISTSEIYNIAFRLLKQRRKGPAARYKLKNAIMELGPSGFPFEQFIARIFRSMGYDTQTGQLIDGKCVRHEVDVVAMKEGEEHLIECKFHQLKGVFCDVKISLYISARFADIRQQRPAAAPQTTPPFKGWLITNTHFSKDAITYGLCAGLNLIGWDFPAKGSLKELIDQYGLHPVTSLTTLTRQEKEQLMKQKIVLCSEIAEQEALLKKMISPERLKKVKAECTYLSGKQL